MKQITLVFPYYENPDMFKRQQRIIMGFPHDLRQNLHVCVCDDGSPVDKAVDNLLEGFSTSCASFQLFRIMVDVRWNWIACRNLCISKARTEWVFHTDIDHTLPASTLRWLIEADHDPDRVYFPFGRLDAPDGVQNPKHHPNTWFHTVAMFDKIGGYDERFSGWYGTDSDFRCRAIEASGGECVPVPNYPVVRWPREVEPTSSCPDEFGRKRDIDRENVGRIKAERAKIKGWRPLRGTFPWERLI